MRVHRKGGRPVYTVEKVGHLIQASGAWISERVASIQSISAYTWADPYKQVDVCERAGSRVTVLMHCYPSNVYPMDQRRPWRFIHVSASSSFRESFYIFVTVMHVYTDCPLPNFLLYMMMINYFHSRLDENHATSTGICLCGHLAEGDGTAIPLLPLHQSGDA